MIADLGSMLLSGALHVASSAPSPLVLHPDPMLDFYMGFCSDDISCVAERGAAVAWDPMLGEAADMCQRMVSRPLSFSPLSFLLGEAPGSPEYIPVSTLWRKVADLNEEATAL